MPPRHHGPHYPFLEKLTARYAPIGPAWGDMGALLQHSQPQGPCESPMLSSEEEAEEKKDGAQQ